MVQLNGPIAFHFAVRSLCCNAILNLLKLCSIYDRKFDFAVRQLMYKQAEKEIVRRVGTYGDERALLDERIREKGPRC
jgi:hypothetical protein